MTDGVQSVFSPRFNPQGGRLIYFESITGWAHHTCAALKMVIKPEVGFTPCNAVTSYDFQIEWDLKAVTTVIDIVKKPQSKSLMTEILMAWSYCTCTYNYAGCLDKEVCHSRSWCVCWLLC